MSSRARDAIPFGRPVGLPDFPGVNGRPMTRGAVSSLIAAGWAMGVRLACSLVGCEAGGVAGLLEFGERDCEWVADAWPLCGFSRVDDRGEWESD